MVFVIPGLIMMAWAINAFSNNASSILQQKFQGAIQDQLSSPASPLELLLAFSLGGFMRGLVVAVLTFTAASFLVDLPVEHILVLIPSLFLVGFFFAQLGVLIGVRAEQFDDVAIAQTFVLQPLIFLGGVFYSAALLPEPFQTLTHFNPVYYMIALVRYGFLGYAEANVALSLLFLDDRDGRAVRGRTCGCSRAATSCAPRSRPRHCVRRTWDASHRTRIAEVRHVSSGRQGPAFDAATGIVGMVVITIGFLLRARRRRPDDSVVKVTNFFVDNRDAILAGNALWRSAAAFFLWWLGSLRSYLRAGEGGEGRLSAAAFGGGIAGVALTLAGAASSRGPCSRRRQPATRSSTARCSTSAALLRDRGAGFAVLLGAAPARRQERLVAAVGVLVREHRGGGAAR